MDLDKPFLPEHVPEAGPNASASKKTRMVGLWGVLIVAFFAIWQVLGNDNGSVEVVPVVAATEICTPPLWQAALTLVVPVLIIIFGVKWITRTYGWLDRFNASQEPGLLALSDGRFPEAALLFRATERSVAKRPLYRCVVALNVGDVLLWSGDPRGAIEEFIRVERTAGVFVGAAPRMLVSIRLAAAYAILGDVDSSELWMKEAGDRMAKTSEARMVVGAKRCWVEAMLLCRKGRFGAAADLLHQRQSLLKAFLDFRSLQAIAVLQVFAAVRADKAIEVATRSAILPIERSTLIEHTKMMASWPEMVEFLGSRPVAGDV